jgi:exodeoxyribonuclease VII small subunit
MKNKLTYAEALAEIELIIQNIEDDKYTLDELSEKVKRISFLINYCKEKLRTTEDELKNVLKNIKD